MSTRGLPNDAMTPCPQATADDSTHYLIDIGGYYN